MLLYWFTWCLFKILRQWTWTGMWNLFLFYACHNLNPYLSPFCFYCTTSWSELQKIFISFFRYLYVNWVFEIWFFVKLFLQEIQKQIHTKDLDEPLTRIHNFLIQHLQMNRQLFKLLNAMYTTIFHIFNFYCFPAYFSTQL